MNGKRWKRIVTLLLCVVLSCPTTIMLNNKKEIQAASTLSIPGKVTATKLNVRTKASTSSAQLTVAKTKVALTKGTAVTIISEKIVSKQKWYYISFKWDGKTKKGYVLSDYVQLTLKSTVAAKVNSTSKVKIRKAAGGTVYLKVSNKTIALANKTKLTITKEVTKKDVKYFLVKFTYSKKTHTGYIEANKVLFTAKKTEETRKAIDTGKVTTDNLRVRVGAGTSKAQMTDSSGAKVYLSKGTKVTIYSVVDVSGTLWYEVDFIYNKKTMTGYISGDYVKLDSEEENDDTAEDTSKEDSSNDDTAKDDPTTDDQKDDTSKDDPKEDDTSKDDTADDSKKEETTTPLSDAEFEQMMTTQGFPESYKPYLRTLHSQYPYWQFEAYHTGLDWSTAVAKESVVGKNLIPNSKNIAWKSMETGAYKWATDSFVVYDGSTWVTASQDIIAYYMDPRNFLTPQGIFQFELLSYQNEYQTVSGLSNILTGTPMAGTNYSFVDDTGVTQTKTYADTFIEAAKYSGVSPYHLASRVKQEVVTSSKTFSSSVTGTVSGYEGLYNFYNIGATHSTEAGGAVANGLKYAKNGTSNAANNALYLIPWTSPYRSIVGGAYIIGSTYIKRGQNTIYLEKFNMTPTSTYSHQYMANVQAAASESTKTYTAYSTMSSVPVVFSIPVFLDMPSTAAPLPADQLNPNNWLKTLSVEGYTITPTFDASIDQNYGLIVEATRESIVVNATTASKKASIYGNGTIPLQVGNNQVVITVVAENGDKRDYTINVVRLSE
ncbi:cadherin-like beta sandwich domain-containing protein [Anaerosporobacter faecicola]|uniref:cadherin-like beta sandwich domain-containing protein n=1 Tax=Anaerosporobacter faecicola TaxID=2718714 RepID=UPI00143B8F49|nr:cadherin-like beta sandwich domain-containing protein [Anaerosporobacter faecicola]